MTDQLDWAYDIARQLPINLHARPQVASALRTAFKRGEASGMRMAADVVLTAPYLSIAGSKIVAASIRFQADQIEKGL